MNRFWALVFLTVPVFGVLTFVVAPYFNIWFPQGRLRAWPRDRPAVHVHPVADGHRVRRHRSGAVLLRLEVRRPHESRAGQVLARQPHAGSRVDDPAGGDAAVHRDLPDERLGRRQDAAARISRSPPKITGRQFNWDVRYPGADGELHTLDDIVRADGDIHFPSGEEVLLMIKSADVLHSFFLPNLRMKQDVVPGMEQYMWFKARETGRFDIVCAELCGWGHYKMKGRATFEPRSEFDAWLEEKCGRATNPHDRRDAKLRKSNRRRRTLPARRHLTPDT